MCSFDRICSSLISFSIRALQRNRESVTLQASTSYISLNDIFGYVTFFDAFDKSFKFCNFAVSRMFVITFEDPDNVLNLWKLS